MGLSRPSSSAAVRAACAVQRRPYDRVRVAESHRSFLQLHESVGFYQLNGMPIVASPGVYHPGPGSSTEFMLRHLPVLENCELLDLGCGSGAIGIHYARQGNRVTLADVDPEALRCAAFNALANHVQARILHSDVFAQIPSELRFDVVLFNLPYSHRPRQHRFDHIGCDDRGAVAQTFFRGLKLHLRKGGVAYVTYSNLADLDLLERLLDETGLTARLIAEETDDWSGVDRFLLEIQN